MEHTPLSRAIFDQHAIALGFEPLGDKDPGAYLEGISVVHLAPPKGAEVKRQLRAALDSAALLDHAGVASGIYQARNLHNNPYPPDHA